MLYNMLRRLAEQMAQQSFSDAYKTIVLNQTQHIWNELRNLLILDPNKTFMHRCGLNNIPNGLDCPYFRTWTAAQTSIALTHPLRSRGSMLPAIYRRDIYHSAGIKPGELDPKDTPKANLSDIRASVLRTGSFKIALTSDPSLHLRFDDETRTTPTLLILDSRTVLMVALLDVTDLMAY